ncbi:5648_t:CDS:2 [Dentiscutata erythropus]|uniref:Saccharopine dehydrogenase [NAD(+), L-lysine-forming] n=1 Tax=Dentiscutata erythropus TaxID=1348616 RepID=A0A9N9HKI3_9GLOM|nr:5648_t:CDS:2 [Dentiscutata erythropus]
MVHLWLRAETKPKEHRAALTPHSCKVLIQNGFQITVEKSGQRTFKEEEYEREGCTIVPSGTWKNAPSDAYIVGLKELPENDNSPLSHSHIYFAHCYKNQDGWQDTLRRFTQGSGTLLDLEFLTDDDGRRLAAFGFHAGFAGAALGLDVWAQQQIYPGEKFPSVVHFQNENELIAYMNTRLTKAIRIKGCAPRIMVIGALGRCGRGAAELARKLDIPEENIIKWDLEETKKGGPFPEILEADIFVNCIYLNQKITPFLTKEMLDLQRKLSVIVDVSCDTTNPNNPIPVYTGCTTFSNPTIAVKTKNTHPLDVIAIDHLPTLLPRESSEQYSKDLLPCLLELSNRDTSKAWVKAEKLFRTKASLIDS